MAAATLKNLWRNSACLVLGTGPIQYLPRPILSDNSLLRCWVVDNEASADKDEEFLFVKRSFKAGFMANIHVFPGGVTDSADYSSSWSDLYCRHMPSSTCRSKTNDVFSTLKSQSNIPLFNASLTGFPGEVALRICAIRETFEETGILLLRRGDQLAHVTDLLPGTFSPSIKVLPVDQSNHWRRLVHSDARNFIAMCRELECVPDVFSLIEWSNWLTPANYFRRYDTVFFFCCTDLKPDTIHDDQEVSKAEWLNLGKAMKLHIDGKIMLSPPQHADISHLNMLGSLPSVHSYALKNASERSLSRKISVRIRCKGGSIVSVTDIDDLFPVEATAYKPKEETTHHCQSPALREVVSLKVVLDNVLYEYECASHTAEQLIDLSTRISRSNIGEDDKWFNIRLYDNVKSEDVKEHLEQYNRLKKQRRSKL